MSRKSFNSDTLFRFIGTVILVTALIASIFPLLWMVTGCFKSNKELFSNPLALPEHISFAVFAEAWRRANFMTALKNSMVNTVGTNVIAIFASSAAAYALARIEFPGSEYLNGMLSSSMVISGQLILIPLFFTIRQYHLYNTIWSTVIADAALDLPICIILFSTFFKEIPDEIEESAILDGCGKLGFYFRFVLPLSKPIVSSVMIFVSLWTWNEYLFALTFLKDDAVRTIPLQLQNFQGRYATEYGLIFAVLSISIIPLIILYALNQRSFIKGLTAGAVKG